MYQLMCMFVFVSWFASKHAKLVMHPKLLLHPCFAYHPKLGNLVFASWPA